MPHGTQECLCQSKCETSLAYPLGPDEEKAAPEATALNGLAELRHHVIVPQNAIPSHWT